MIEILNRCNYLIEHLKDCENIDVKINCPTCMSNSFYGNNSDTYDCLKKLCYYTINYGPIYVSEIYHFLLQSHLLENIIYVQRQNLQRSSFMPIETIPVTLNVMSLGCGFGPDDIALSKYRVANNLQNVYFNYYGYDKEPLWNYITQTNSLPLTYDLLYGMNFQNINILFINKLFSTLFNHSLHIQFLERFEQALNTLPSNSYVIFNDRNVLDLTEKSSAMGSFHPKMDSYGLQLVEKYFFNVAKEKDGKLPMNYNNRYIEIQDHYNICTLPTSLVHQPKLFPNQTVFFVYQKV